LQETPKEIEILFKELLIGVTSFFRDNTLWDYLKETIIPELINESSDKHTLRAWILGCSTGEEAYSLAIVFKEAMDKVKKQEFNITLVSIETAITTNDKRWFNIRIMPYRAIDDHIDGLVITFTDITTAKKMEIELKEINETLREKK
jgi:hypothetical protein